MDCYIAFSNALGCKLHSLIQLILDFLSGVVFSPVFEVCSDCRRAFLSCLFPWFSLVIYLTYSLTCCSHEAISLLWIFYTKISTVFESALGLELPYTLFQIRSDSLSLEPLYSERLPVPWAKSLGHCSRAGGGNSVFIFLRWHSWFISWTLGGSRKSS